MAKLQRQARRDPAAAQRTLGAALKADPNYLPAISLYAGACVPVLPPTPRAVAS